MISAKQSLAQEVYGKLKELIIYNKIQPGDIITVGEMAGRFNVSKTPVRDSLNALKHEGLIEVLPYKGYFVSRVDIKILLDLFQMRTILEGAAAELAAKNATAEIIEGLTALAYKDLTSQENTVSFMQTNFNFHMAIAAASGNQYLCKSLSNVLEQLQRVLYTDLISGDPEQMQKEHQELVQCIINQDHNEAKRLVNTQIEATRKRILKNI